MKEQPSAYSPFAALDTREKMEQWIWWQCQHPKETPVDASHSIAAVLPEKTREEAKAAPQPPKQPVMQPVRHGQYDAVIRRMNSASKQAVNYISWTE